MVAVFEAKRPASSEIRGTSAVNLRLWAMRLGDKPGRLCRREQAEHSALATASYEGCGAGAPMSQHAGCSHLSHGQPGALSAFIP